MDERELLLRSILDRPDDDATRLIYADKLDEVGGEANAARAEFIRLQVESARLEAITTRWATTPSDQPGGSAEDGGEAGAALARSQILENDAAPLLAKWGRDWLPPGARGAARVRFDLAENSFGDASDSLVVVGAVNRVLYNFHRGFIRGARVEYDTFHSDRPLEPDACAAAVLDALACHPIGAYAFAVEDRCPLVRLNVRRLKGGWRFEYREIYDRRNYTRRTHKMLRDRDVFCHFLAERFRIWLQEVTFEEGLVPY